MQILSPDEIKKDKTESADQSMKRSKALALEESRVNREMNLIRTTSEAEKAEIKAKTEAYREEMAQYRETLKLEVESLESRRRDSLIPIKETQKEAEILLQQAKDALEDIKLQKENIEAGREENIEFAEELRDREDSLSDRAENLQLRERRISDEERRLKDSSSMLAQKWVDLHVATTSANTDIAQREQKVGMAEKTFESRQREQDARERELNNKERAIADKYATLIRTQDRLKNTP